MLQDSGSNLLSLVQGSLLPLMGHLNQGVFPEGSNSSANHAHIGEEGLRTHISSNLFILFADSGSGSYAAIHLLKAEWKKHFRAPHQLKDKAI